ncbi:MAG: class III poly(R)-hydroxyalkanoic acid synthase subunit PhaC [Phycisphaerae bacterium]|nr:class III poly(R)-hydroxyalkanoic acid synthase subunit PhaC [Phycisphaerae bacterium]
MTTAAAPNMPWFPHPADVQRFWEDAFRKVAAMPKVLEVARKVRKGVTPSEPVYQFDRVRLMQYEQAVEQVHGTPLIFVFALVNRPYILDLGAGKSVVEHFVQGGFDCYNVDWGIPTSADRHLGMREYVEGYLDDVVNHVRERTGSDKVSILGYCMGGSMSAMYTALHPEKIANLILLAAPVDWSNTDHLLGRWVDPSVFDVDRLIDVCGNAPADMLQGSFLLLKPVSNLVEKYVRFYENMENEKFLEDFFAMETWLNDNIPVAGEMFRQFVKRCMQENQLIQGRLRIGGRTVDLRNITCPVLNLTAQHDHLVPCGQSQPFCAAVGSADKETITFPAGHIGMAVGSKANRELWPRVKDWLAQRSEPMA